MPRTRERRGGLDLEQLSRKKRGTLSRSHTHYNNNNHNHNQQTNQPTDVIIVDARTDLRIKSSYDFAADIYL